MAFKKGQITNPNGRPKGSPNRSTRQIRDAIALFVDKNIDKIQKEFNLMEPKDKLMFFERVLRYVIPVKKEVLNVDAMTDSEVERLAAELIAQMNGDPENDKNDDHET